MTEATQSQVERLRPWFHNLHLPDGTQTCPEHTLGDYPSFKWRAIADRIPEDLTGWSAIDIGCNAGFYSFELARRGAHVVAIEHDAHYLAQARWAAAQYGLVTRVEFRQSDVYELADSDEKFDLVLFLGVLYHLRYPVLGLDIVSRRVGKLLVVQSLTTPGDAIVSPPADLDLNRRERLQEPGWPKMAFIERRLANDPTNWWAPSRACIEALLRSTGMRILSGPEHEIYVCEPDPNGASNMWRWNEPEFSAAVGRRRDADAAMDQRPRSSAPADGSKT